MGPVKARLTTREQRLIPLIVLLGAGILCGYFIYVVGPLSREMTDLGQRVRAARDKVRLLETATSNEVALQDQHNQLDHSVMALRRMLPSEDELPSVIALLTDLANQAQVKIQTIFPQRTAADSLALDSKGGSTDSSVYKEILIQIDALAGYHQLGTFLNLVESSEKPMRLASLRISSNANAREVKQHQVKLLLRAYFATKSST